jgi:1-deoxy-D-xylulose-5-phosphate synthase
VINGRWVKPLDTELVAQFVKAGTRVFTVEENAVAGGYGSAVSEALDALGIVAPLHRLGIPDRYVPHATQGEQRADLGIDEEGLLLTFREKTTGAGVVPIRIRAAS